MAISWHHIRALASSLEKSAPQYRTNEMAHEAMLRSAMSRYYYAVYHHALDVASVRGYTLPVKGEGAHDHLWDFFDESLNSVVIASSGRNLKLKRKHADYQLKRRDISEEAVERVKVDAEEVHRSLQVMQ